MASFFRWRIANKVIPFLVQGNEKTKIALPSVISSFVKVHPKSWINPQLHLPWRKITNLSPEIENVLTPSKLVTFLRNQGLPTREGFIDIGLTDSPLSLTFTVDKHVYSKIVLTDICGNDENMSKSSCLFQDVPHKKVLVQYSLPATGEMFGMADFRTVIHANFIANINKFIGNDVLKISTSADSDFWSALLLTGYKHFSRDDELHKNPSCHLLEISKMAKIQYENDLIFKKKVDKCFENLKSGDDEMFSDWHHLRTLCQNQNNSLYKKLALNAIDINYICDNQKVHEIYENFTKMNVFSNQQDNKVSVNLQEELSTTEPLCFDKTASIIDQLCSNIHAIVQAKAKHKFDVLYYVDSSFQKTFFSILLALLKKLGLEWSENEIKFIELNKILDFDSMKRKKLSAEDIFNKAKLIMLKKLEAELYIETDENLEDLAEALSYACVHVFDMMHKRKFNYSFDWKEILHFGKDSGSSFQLCHSGLKGVQEETEFKFNVNVDTSPLLEPEAHKLVLHLSRFDEIIYKTYITLEPYYLYQYLSSLWYYVDAAANVLKLDIKSDRLRVIKARLLLLSAALKVLQKCLILLGLKPYENKYFQRKLVKL